MLDVRACSGRDQEVVERQRVRLLKRRPRACEQRVLFTVRSSSFLGGRFLDPHLGTKAKKHTKS